MSELCQKILEHFQHEQYYSYSQDVSVKADEQQAIAELAHNGYITVKMRTIGYVIAEIS